MAPDLPINNAVSRVLKLLFTNYLLKNTFQPTTRVESNMELTFEDLDKHKNDSSLRRKQGEVTPQEYRPSIKSTRSVSPSMTLSEFVEMKMFLA